MVEKATTKRLMEFFGMTAKEFMKEWKELSVEDKNELRKGMEDGSLSY